MASGVSASGYVLSMTGVTFPDSMSSLRASRSSWFSEETKARRFWLTNGESLFAVPTVLLCSEAEPERCHRRLILEYLDLEWGGIKAVHL
jgi:Domain of unknown function DUF488